MRQTLLLLASLFATPGAEKVQVKIPKPYNLSVSWPRPFHPNLSWMSHHPTKNCEDYMTCNAANFQDSPTKGRFWSGFVVMNGGSLGFTVKTVCGDKESDPAEHTFTNPELVKDLRCLIHSSKETVCSWLPTNNTQEIRFYFGLLDNTNAGKDEEQRECPSYMGPQHARTGCRFRIQPYHSIQMVLNGTTAGGSIFNTYQDDLVEVKLEPLNWMVAESPDKLRFHWSPPDVLSLYEWTFYINYTECNKIKSHIVNGRTSAEIPRVPHCSYQIQMRAETRASLITHLTPGPRGVIQLSKEKQVDALVDDTMVYVAILAPLVLGSLTVLAFVCCRKNKDKIFPKIPKPRNLISDIYDDNKNNLYTPTKEEDFKISLVIEPQLAKPAI